MEFRNDGVTELVAVLPCGLSRPFSGRLLLIGGYFGQILGKSVNAERYTDSRTAGTCGVRPNLLSAENTSC